MIQSLSDDIEERIEDHLPEYKKLSYAVDLEKNAKLRHSKRYGVVVGPAPVVQGPLGRTVLDVNVNITLTDDYVEPTDDIAKRQKSNDIADTLISIYNYLTNNKPSNVSMLRLTEISTTQYLSEKVLYRTATIVFRLRA